MKINDHFYRPLEVDILYGDSTETKKLLNWEPKTTFKELVKKMILHDIDLLTNK
jgi:GDPmannose 4,6-dehydratase